MQLFGYILPPEIPYTFQIGRQGWMGFVSPLRDGKECILHIMHGMFSEIRLAVSLNRNDAEVQLGFKPNLVEWNVTITHMS